ncbi:hypothetical protein KDK77_00065 [bacterium]|nr:hypothetical protein [bacterium]MCP5461604.1 hypothetical protein [bacterium]
MLKIIVAICVMLLLEGCKTVQTYYEMTDTTYVSSNYYINPHLENIMVKRVLFAPLKNETLYREEVEALEKTFAEQWSAIHRFEVIPAMGEVRKNLQEVALRDKGRFYKLLLYDIGERYNIDAIIFTTITSFFPYEPCKLGVNAQMIHTRSGDVLWAIDEQYDGNQRDVGNLAKEYYYEKLQFSHPLTDWKIMLVSMKYFSQMIGNHIAETLLEKERNLRIDESLLKTATALELP